MANFVLLYNGGGMGANEAEQAAIMQAWGAWYGKLGSCRRWQSLHINGKKYREQRNSK